MKLAVAVLVVLGGAVSFAQTALDLPRFEVATVKPAAEMTPAQKAAFVIRRGPVYFDYPQISIVELVMIAYDMDGTRIVVPGSLTKARFDAMAKAPEAVTLDQMRPMLRRLLEERLALVVHRETRSVPVYEITVAKSGLKMVETGTADDPRASPLPEQKPGGPMWIEPGKAQMKRNTRSSDRVTQVAGRGQRMADLEFLVSRSVRDKRIVVDKTGLAGAYDFGVQFVDPGSEMDPRVSVSRDVPGIFAAFEQYLGLRLEAKNGPVELLVVDSAKLDPGEN